MREWELEQFQFDISLQAEDSIFSIRDQAIELVQVRFPLEGGIIPEGGYSGGEAFLKAEL